MTGRKYPWSPFKHDSKADTAFFYFKMAAWVVVCSVTWLAVLGVL